MEGWPAEVEEWGDVIVNKVWTVLPDMMVPRSNNSLSMVQWRLVEIGGYQGTETTTKVEVLDRSSNTWEEVGEGVCCQAI